MNDRQAFATRMSELCVVHGVEASAMLMDAWWRACETLSDFQFLAGVDTVVKQIDRFPTPAAVRAAAYAAKEERDVRVGSDTGIPGVPQLEPGPMVTQNRAEGRKYAAAHLVASGHVTPLYDCLRCRDRHFVRVDVMVGTPHFGASIPCPHCRGDRYEAYTQKHGVPPGMPKWSA
jgi:hypothetical protein